MLVEGLKSISPASTSFGFPVHRTADCASVDCPNHMVKRLFSAYVFLHAAMMASTYVEATVSISLGTTYVLKTITGQKYIHKRDTIR